MCRNITTLRGLTPTATPEEIQAAARQYVRKVSGVQSTSAQTEDGVRAGGRRDRRGDGDVARGPTAAEATATDPSAAPAACRTGRRNGLNMP